MGHRSLLKVTVWASDVLLDLSRQCLLALFVLWHQTLGKSMVHVAEHIYLLEIVAHDHLRSPSSVWRPELERNSPARAVCAHVHGSLA